ncbi:hypothetical protein SETIT_1G169200v2 [Setaria italica]|uniref:Uncharacterized protein n=1 Tax=Setaria italica TaxID=4555 RepID=A0A368PL58_SETIT|nr:hypothetical protein SETIT_1G169200v2 [Setaria italica]
MAERESRATATVSWRCSKVVAHHRLLHDCGGGKSGTSCWTHASPAACSVGLLQQGGRPSCRVTFSASSKAVLPDANVAWNPTFFTCASLYSSLRLSPTLAAHRSRRSHGVLAGTAKDAHKGLDCSPAPVCDLPHCRVYPLTPNSQSRYQHGVMDNARQLLEEMPPSAGLHESPYKLPWIWVRSSLIKVNQTSSS